MHNDNHLMLMENCQKMWPNGGNEFTQKLKASDVSHKSPMKLQSMFHVCVGRRSNIRVPILSQNIVNNVALSILISGIEKLRKKIAYHCMKEALALKLYL